MRRYLILLFVLACFTGACSPTVTLISRETPPSATAPAATLPPAVERTPIPTPTQTRSLGISPDALQGVGVVIWHGWGGSSASLLGKMASDFNQNNQWGIKVTLESHGNLNLLAADVEKSLTAAEHPDIVIALPEQILAWKEQVVDLAPYLAQPEIGFALADLPPAFGDQSQLKDVRYGMPAARSARFIFYNLSFARDLGFTTAPLNQEIGRAHV